MAHLAPLHAALVRVVLVDRPLQRGARRHRRYRPSGDARFGSDIDHPDSREHSFTAAFAGQMAIDADELQYQRGYGPCMDAARAGQVFLIRDMRMEHRWPDYARHAAAHGVRSSLSVPLPFQDITIGALNNYSSHPDAFGDEDVSLGQEVAGWVAVAVETRTMRPVPQRTWRSMRAAMVARAVIEQAKGILMERHKSTEDDAFRLLARASQDTNTKLRVVADNLVRTGALRGVGGSTEA